MPESTLAPKLSKLDDKYGPLPDVAFCVKCKKDLPITEFTDNKEFRQFLDRRKKGRNSPTRCSKCGPVFVPPPKARVLIHSGQRPLDSQVRVVATHPIQTAVSGSRVLGNWEERRRLYTKYIASNAWMRVRVRVFNRRGVQCEKCGSTDGTRLDIHHLTYERLGFERDEDLQILCQACHRKAHGRDVFGERIQWK